MNKNYFRSLNNESIWMDDNSVTSCHNCKDNFSLFNRRHHCRLCGKIFCGVCSKSRIFTNINDELIKIDDYLEECLNENKKLCIKKKLCFQCKKILDNINEIAKYIKILELLDLDIKVKYNLLLVSKNWNKAVLYYLYNFKKLHYLTIYDDVNKVKKLININENYLNGHNKLVSLYIILNGNDWIESEIKDKMKRLENRNIKCCSLLCKENCTKSLSNYNIIYILFYIKNKALKKYLLGKLRIKDIKVYLPLFIKLLENDNVSDYSITDYLIMKCNSIEIYIELFLQLFILIKNQNCLVYKNILQRIKDKLKNSDSKKYDIVINSIKFINKLSNLSINLLDNKIIEINNYIKENDIYIYHLVKKR